MGSYSQAITVFLCVNRHSTCLLLAKGCSPEPFVPIFIIAGLLHTLQLITYVQCSYLGYVLTRNTIEEIVRFAHSENLLILADEVNDRFKF